jgi:hypothetical protein
MELNLELVQTFDRPAGVENYHWSSATSPDRKIVGLPGDRDILQVFEWNEGRLRPTTTFPLPAITTYPALHERELSIHPDGQLIAAASRNGVQLIEPDGTSQPIAEEIKGEPRAVLFSRKGDKLWVSYEDPQAQTNFICLADCGTLSLIDTLEIGGLDDSYHALWYHPSRDVVAVEVSCGSPGSWLTFIEEVAWGLGRMAHALERVQDPFYMAGFSPDGSHFTVADLSKVQLRQWPSCKLVAEIAPPADNDVFCWVATWIGELFAAGWVTQPNEQYGIMFNDRDLEPQCHALWERPEDQDYIMFELLGLPKQRLMVIGDQRAGLFEVK